MPAPRGTKPYTLGTTETIPLSLPARFATLCGVTPPQFASLPSSSLPSFGAASEGATTPVVGALDLGAIWESAWPWLWPSLALIAWLAGSIFLVVRWRGWMTRRFASGSSVVSERAIKNLVRVVVLGAWLIGLYIWAMVVPLEGSAKAWVKKDAEPWVFATIMFAAFLALGFYGIRRALMWLETRAAQTETALDDALIEALHRPAYVSLVLLAVNLWASIVPIPTALQNYVQKGSETTVIVLVVLFVDGLVQGWMLARSERSKVLKTSGGVLRTSARVIIYIIGSLMVLSSIGFDVTPVLATLGIGSAAAGFALKGTLEDFLAGLLIAADQPLSVGDYIIVDDQNQGWVLAIGWRTTRLLTRFDMHVIVPNSKLAQSAFVNTSRPREEVRFHAISMISFREDLDEVVRIASEIGDEVQQNDPRAVPTYRSFAFVEVFQPGYVELRCWLCAKSWDAHFGLRDAYLRKLQRGLREVGVIIAGPTQILETRAGTALSLTLEGPADGPRGRSEAP